MKTIARQVLVGALTIIFLNAACGSLTGASRTPVGTILPEEETGIAPTSTVTPSITATGISVTPLIPITGENVVSMQCQFCVEGETHAVLIFPDFAYFDVASTSPVSCLTADVVNGKRILICRGAPQTSFELNICADSTNCLQFPVGLQECPLLQAGTPQATFTPFTPFFLTPINTLLPPTEPDSRERPSPTPTRRNATITPTLPVPTSTRTSSPPTATITPPPPATHTILPPTVVPTIEPTVQPTTEPSPEPEPPTIEPTTGSTEGSGG